MKAFLRDVLGERTTKNILYSLAIRSLNEGAVSQVILGYSRDKQRGVQTHEVIMIHLGYCHNW